MKVKRIISITAHASANHVPRLLIAGKYMSKDWGFDMYDKVEVQYIAPGELHIKKIERNK